MKPKTSNPSPTALVLAMLLTLALALPAHAVPTADLRAQVSEIATTVWSWIGTLADSLQPQAAQETSPEAGVDIEPGG